MKLGTTLLIIFISISVNSQDLIFLKNGDEIESRIIEVSISQVSFKKESNLNGPIYKISINEIFMIKYSNGSKDVFKEKLVSKKKKSRAERIMSNGYYSCAVIYDWDKKIYTQKNVVLMNLKFEEVKAYFNLIRIPKSELDKDGGHRLSSRIFTDRKKTIQEIAKGKLHIGHYEILENMIKITFPDNPAADGKIPIIYGFINDNSIIVKLRYFNNETVNFKGEHVLNFMCF